MKKIIAILLAFAMLLTLSACGEEKEDDPNFGKYFGTTVDVLGQLMDMAEVYEGECYVELKADDVCVMMLGDTSGKGTWTLNGEDIVLTIDGVDSTGTLKDGVLTVDLLGMGMEAIFVKSGSAASNTETQSTEPSTEEQSLGNPWWRGDWYGWWVVENAGGNYSDLVDSYWDACARIEFLDDSNGHITIWDEDYTFDSATIEVDVSFGAGTTENGCMMSESGYFWDAEVGHADWIVDPGASTVSSIDHMIWIDGTYEDPDNGENWLDYSIYLRPWGMDWEDVRTMDTEGLPYDDMMPKNYDSWYLPLISQGITSAPDSFTDTPAGDPSAAGTEAPGAATEGNSTVAGDALYDYHNRGILLFSYPSDIFTFDDSFGIDALETADGSLRITFYADSTEEDFRNTVGNYDTYTDYEDYAMEEITIAGYHAVQFTYNCWGDYYIDTCIDFGEDAGEYRGICISVRSYNSFEECRSAAVESILYSIQVAN